MEENVRITFLLHFLVPPTLFDDFVHVAGSLVNLCFEVVEDRVDGVLENDKICIRVRVPFLSCSYESINFL